MSEKLLPILWSILRVGILIAILFLIRAFIVEQYRVNGPSMEPTLRDKSTVIGIKYDKKYVRGQVVMYTRPGRSDISIGRVVALPGDMIRIEDGNLWVNDIQEAEEYLLELRVTFSDDNWFLPEGEEKTVPKDSFFILGDNREGSIDSRQWGFVPRENIEAQYLRCALNC